MVTDIAMPVFSTLKLKSKQGLSLPVPAKGQLHWLKRRVDEFRVFALVLNVDGEMCDVIPGSMDALIAGPDDIVLPRNIMGNFVMLSPGGLLTMPIESLGIGFARLDTSVFNDIVEYTACLSEGKECEIAFSKGFPYLDEEDDRIEYHQKMIDGFIVAQNGTDSKMKVEKYPRLDWFVAAQKIRFWSTRVDSENTIQMAAACSEGTQSRYYRFVYEESMYELIVSASRQRGLIDCAVCNSNGELARELHGLFIILGEEGERIEVKNGRCNFPLEFARNGFCLSDALGHEIVTMEH